MIMRVPGLLQAFAAQGDRVVIPNPAQADGSVSFAQGWGPDYQKDQATDPNAKPIDRASTNYLMYAMSQLIRRWQTETYPEWISPADNGGVAYAYTKGSVVRVGATLGTLRISLVDNNTEQPTEGNTTAKWGDPSGSLAFALLNSEGTSAPQNVGGPLNLMGGAIAPGPAQTARGAELVNASWVTDGAASQVRGQSTNAPPTSGYLRLPTWMSTGSTTRFLLQWGSGTIPGNSGNPPNIGFRTVAFPLSFTSVPVVMVTPTYQPNTAGLGTCAAYNNISVGSFSAVIDASAANTSNGIFSNPCSFDWFAIGEGA